MKGKQKRVYQIVFIVLLASFYQYSLSDELSERREIQNQAINALKKNKFQELERVANKYRTQSKRTSSGLWPLTFFYLGITNYAGWSAQYPDDIWIRQKERTEKWIKKYPDSPTPYIAHSIFLEQLAYTYRVSSNQSVTPKDMQKLNRQKSNKLMEAARKFLIKNKSIADKDPHWYVEMIRIATGQRWNEKKYMLLVDEAVNKYPMYLQIYFAAVDYYSPKFGGNITQMDKFARYATKHTKNKIGMSLYARIYWAAIQSWPSKEVWSKINWNDFKSGIDTVLKSYPDEWNINNFALFACMAGDKPKARELIGKMQKEPMTRVWGKEYFYKCSSALGIKQNSARGQSGI